MSSKYVVIFLRPPLLCLLPFGSSLLLLCHRYQRLCGLLERHSRRDDLLYAMVGACDLPERLTVVAPARATDVHLRAYHDRDYVEVRTQQQQV